ncbi:MAG: oxidoreductase, partial [Clostridia bacterium]|nr:oxidoreductase [Clostridia bacterium]
DATFLKGYQWPFDPRKLGGDSVSSKVDIAVYNEMKNGRRVYLDFTKNPAGFDFSLIGDEARQYLINSGALLGTPIERLEKMNAPAIKLYADHGIDLTKELLEISVCAQHNNGGLAVTTDYESTTLRHFYPAGECAGVFGVYRPGGSALNSTQVSSTRAAQKIAEREPEHVSAAAIKEEIEKTAARLMSLDGGKLTLDGILAHRREYGKIMSDCGAFLRDRDKIVAAIAYFKCEYDGFDEKYKLADISDVGEAMINRDVIITALTYLSAIRDYIDDGGRSRGSYLIIGCDGIDEEHWDKVEYTSFSCGAARSRFEDRRPIPDSEQWFETVYNKFKK